MPATFAWVGADESGVPFDVGGSGSAVRFTQSNDWDTPTSESPIPAGQASMERYFRSRFTGSFTSISNVRFWRSDPNALLAGLTIRLGGISGGMAFATPSLVANSDAVVPTSDPGAANVSVDGSGATRYAPALVSGNARWLRTQAQTSVSTPPGNFSTGTPHLQFTETYDES